MEWDDEGLDEPGSPLLPPEDRLWRHPSEVVSTGSVAPARAGHAGSSPRVVTVVALTSCISVLVTLGVVAVVRPFGRGGDGEGPAMTPTGSLSTVADVAALTAQVRPAIAHVRAVGAGPDGADVVGSGVLLRADGLVLTAHHVVAGASSLRVVLDDGRRLAARLVGADPDTDVAVLDLDGAGFPVASLASAGRAGAVGDPAITIGAPAGEASAGPLVRTTMVSAVGQEADVAGQRLMDLIRIDGPMASGCAGGAVVDRDGRVIGIVMSEEADSEGAATAGYATPIAAAAAVADQLVTHGRVVRGWLGIEGGSRDGALVQGVKADSPAAVAGLAVGDVITAIDGVAVGSMSALVSKLRTHQPGDAVRLSIRRGATDIDVRATLGEKPPA